jgi:hypothetical protein
MKVNSKTLAQLLGISASAVSQLLKRGVITPIARDGRCVFFEIPDVLIEYDENINHGISLANQANRIDGWGQRKKVMPVIEQGCDVATKPLH